MKFRKTWLPSRWEKKVGPVYVLWTRTSYHVELERELYVSLSKYSVSLSWRNDDKYSDNSRCRRYW